MGILLNAILSIASVVLQVVSSLDVTVMSPFGIYQPKTPKSLLR